MINDKYVSPDWVGTARAEIEGAIGSAPAMYVQGFCGDVNCHHIFGTPAQARSTGTRLGKAAVDALPTLIPARTAPFAVRTETVRIDCQPMYTHPELDQALKLRHDYIDSLATDPGATWFAGINAPEFMNTEERTAFVQVQIDHLEEGANNWTSNSRQSAWATSPQSSHTAKTSRRPVQISATAPPSSTP
jgi:hypothetical protein